MNQPEIRAQLEAMRGQLDAILADLSKPPPPPAPAEPSYIAAYRYAAARQMGMVRLSVYFRHGCPHRRRGRARLVDPAQADAWIVANENHPTVVAAVRAAIDAANQKPRNERSDDEAV